jgi:hypothetical protein
VTRTVSFSRRISGGRPIRASNGAGKRSGDVLVEHRLEAPPVGDRAIMDPPSRSATTL